MKLISDLWATGIPNFDPMLTKEPTNMSFNELTPQMIIRPPPSNVLVMDAVSHLESILRPPRLSGNGYRRTRLNHNLQTRLEDMVSVLRVFLTGEQWVKVSQQVAVAKGRGSYYGRVLRHWIHAFILDLTSLPTNAWGSGNVCRLDTEDGLCGEL